MQINTCKLTDDVKQRNKKGETKEKVQGLYSGANHRGKPQYDHLLKSKSSASPLTEKLSHAKKKLILRESTNLALSKWKILERFASLSSDKRFSLENLALVKIVRVVIICTFVLQFSLIGSSVFVDKSDKS